MRYRNLTTALLIVSLCFVCAAADAKPLSKELQAALKQAGKNAGELRTALKKVPEAQREGLEFLIVNMPQRDLASLKADFLLENTQYAYEVMGKVPWGKQVPKDIFLNYVLPYVNLNERRDNWRKDFYTRFMPLIKGCKTPGDAGMALNCKVFPLVKVHYNKKRKKADQSPYESIKSGMASCTGLSILLVDACRACGVPARFVGTPLWSDKSGNHSWVEIWHEGKWHYTGGGEPGGKDAKGLNRGWFGGRASGAKRDNPHHAIYAASFKRTPLRFPLVWSLRIDYVHAVNVTDRYTQKKTPLPEGHGRLRIVAMMKGRRLPAQVKMVDAKEKKTVFEGTTKDDRFDGNDHLTAILPLDREYRVEMKFVNRTMTQTVKFAKDEQRLVLDIAKAKAITSPRRVLSEDERKFAESETGKKLTRLLKTYFDTEPEKRADIAFTPELDKLVIEKSKAVRKMAWQAYCAGWMRKHLAAEVKGKCVKWEKLTSPYIVRAVGAMPADGWPLFIAMHGGGGAPKHINDSQWRVMTRYYRNHAEKGGYLYLAPRSPLDTWNSFYCGYNLHLTDRLIRQMLLLTDVDPNKVYLMGYSHGGYGAFFQGMRMADRFAAVHASAAAPTGYGPVWKNLRNTRFTYMVGARDTQYGRRDKCKWMDEQIKRFRGNRKDVYPVTLEVKPGGHAGLPDRDKIRDMYPHVRNPVPQAVTWQPEVKHFNWLGVPEPRGGLIEASCRNNKLRIDVKRVRQFQVFLDERLIDYGKEITLDIDGHKSKRKVTPSLKTLCETLHERGDPEYMFATRLVITSSVTLEQR